ncbi:MAG: type II secretion system protein GspM [Paracoccaceae bacterium]
MKRLIPQSLMSWLAARDSREQLLLRLGAVVLIAAVVFLGVWQPLLANREAQLARIARYDRLSAALSELPTTARTTPDARPIATILAQTAAAQGLAILRLDTPKAETATLTLQDAPFETLVLWIDGLNHDTGLAVTSATIRRTETAGTVSADLSLERVAP